MVNWFFFKYSQIIFFFKYTVCFYLYDIVHHRTKPNIISSNLKKNKLKKKSPVAYRKSKNSWMRLRQVHGHFMFIARVTVSFFFFFVWLWDKRKRFCETCLDCFQLDARHVSDLFSKLLLQIQIQAIFYYYSCHVVLLNCKVGYIIFLKNYIDVANKPYEKFKYSRASILLL